MLYIYTTQKETLFGDFICSTTFPCIFSCVHFATAIQIYNIDSKCRINVMYTYNCNCRSCFISLKIYNNLITSNMLFLPMLLSLYFVINNNINCLTFTDMVYCNFKQNGCCVFYFITKHANSSFSLLSKAF